MDMRRRRTGQMNLSCFRLRSRFRTDDGQTVSPERECFQYRCEGGQLPTQVPCGLCGGGDLFGLNGDDPLVGDICCAHSTFGFKLAPDGVTFHGRE